MEAKFVKFVIVEDPETNGSVELAVYKHDNGGMFAMDSSFLEQVAEDNSDLDCYCINDPFTLGEPNELYLYDN